MANAITPWSLLAAAGVLLAFLIGFYTLIGRERKSPHLINSFFWTALPTVLSAFVAVISIPIKPIQAELLIAGSFLLLLALFLTLWQVYKMYVRFAYFVDRISIKDIPLWRYLKNLWRSIRPKGTYEHNPITIDEALLVEIRKMLKEFSANTDGYRERSNIDHNSLTIALNNHSEATDLLVQLMKTFLENGHTVQYLAASRHPSEVIQALKVNVDQQASSQWPDWCQKIVVVDAFSPHFGFTDSIHDAKTRQIESIGVTCLKSAVSYAGLHTASSRAFNVIKARSTSNVRSPTLVVYEDTHSLTDLESHKMYRVFVRHVLPSERMWDGMFTVFAEIAPERRNWEVLRSYGGICIDMRSALTQDQSTKRG